MLNTPFLADSSTGTVMFLHVIAQAVLMKAAAAAVVRPFVMVAVEIVVEQEVVMSEKDSVNKTYKRGCSARLYEEGTLCLDSANL